jgi:tRNA-splicing ligase RtcB (3'-phosphate/5'-hydroxy nucleic acid ligase)
MKEKLERINDFEWRLPKTARAGMNVDGKVIASKNMLNYIEEETIQQLTNVAMLPGVVEPVCAMPDAHWGYGLPMGSVAAFDINEGIISSGLCGFDINCGINLIRTNLAYDEIKGKIKDIIDALYAKVPVGVGSKGSLKLDYNILDEVLVKGTKWCVDNGYGTQKDMENMEEHGFMKGGDPSKVSQLAKKRGLKQLGTLGAGNHFLELQRTSRIFDPDFAAKKGINSEGQVCIMLHCGSRGFGHQVATDYLQIQEKAVEKYGIKIADKQLACAPANSDEGMDYYSAMKCAVNYSFANRLVMTQWIREVFEKIFDRDWESMDMHTVYGLCHNVVKQERLKVDGKERDMFIHRKGATRSYPDQPVILAGSMGTASWLLKGTEESLTKSFGSSAHGAGRAMSRNDALKNFKGEQIRQELAAKNIFSRAPSPQSLAEEAPKAYKDVDLVVESVHEAGISLKVAELKPIGVIKG